MSELEKKMLLYVGAKAPYDGIISLNDFRKAFDDVDPIDFGLALSRLEQNRWLDVDMGQVGLGSRGWNKIRELQGPPETATDLT